MHERRVFLGMPNYGKADMQAAKAFFRASQDMSRVVKYHPSSSLLGSNFNDIWCSALNEVHDGGHLDYFAMLHDDVAPEDFWLDKLIKELEANDLDMLGVVVPIKDTRGMTSLALARDGDDWNPLCRLSMFDVYCLPPTFTSVDVGHLLLLNTGCWVVRWKQDIFGKLPDPSSMNGSNLVGCQGPHFEINDRIVFNRTKNCYQAQTEPEDWNFSRQCHRLGLRIGATRKINLHHVGQIAFQNSLPWGSHPFDIEALKESPVPKVDRDGFAFPRDVQGWLTYDEGKALWQLAAGKRVLEIGSYFGLSTICLAQSAVEVVSIDPHDGRGTAIPQNTFDTFIANLQRYGVRQKVNPIIGTMFDEVVVKPAGKFDLVFIDGAHDYDSVKADIENAMALLDDDGLLVFHDYHSARDPDVTTAVDELMKSGGELLATHASVAVVRTPAGILSEV